MAKNSRERLQKLPIQLEDLRSEVNDFRQFTCHRSLLSHVQINAVREIALNGPIPKTATPAVGHVGLLY